MKKLFEQIIKFGIVGGLAFLIDYGIMVLCKEVFKFDVLVAAGFGFTVSVIFNYIASVKWVFNVDKDKNATKSFIIFIIFSVIGLLLNDLIVWFTIDKFNMYYLLGKLIATCFVMIFNFITRKMFLE